MLWGPDVRGRWSVTGKLYGRGGRSDTAASLRSRLSFILRFQLKAQADGAGLGNDFARYSLVSGYNSPFHRNRFIILDR